MADRDLLLENYSGTEPMDEDPALIYTSLELNQVNKRSIEADWIPGTVPIEDDENAPSGEEVGFPTGTRMLSNRGFSESVNLGTSEAFSTKRNGNTRDIVRDYTLEEGLIQACLNHNLKDRSVDVGFMAMDIFSSTTPISWRFSELQNITYSTEAMRIYYFHQNPTKFSSFALPK